MARTHDSAVSHASSLRAPLIDSLKRGTRCLIGLLIISGLCACGPQLTHYVSYTGDGTFVAHPAPTAICHDGYTVDFGAVDLAKHDERMLHLDGLPAIEATIGIALNAKGADTPVASALIELTLRDEQGRIVLSRHERLSEWIRSFAADSPSQAYLYQRGTLIDVAVTPVTARSERFPLGPDDS
jgi:hypothetical protein